MAGGSGTKKRARRRPNPAALLTDNLLVEILARVPYSTRWRALIANPDHRARLPQTLTGFLYGTGCARNGFANVSGIAPPFIDASFSFLPDREREHLMGFDYLVLNPATEKWVAVPVRRRWTNRVQTVRLGFDPAVSPHFYVFEFQSNFDDNDDEYGDGEGDGCVLGVKIYSSGTGAWIHKQSGWTMSILLELDFRSVFLDGVMYVIASDCVIGAVDVDGETWRVIEFPRSKDSPFYDTSLGFIDQSQRRLHFANADDVVGDKLTVKNGP
nr:unnamed protein product [Digitaria exilis]